MAIARLGKQEHLSQILLLDSHEYLLEVRMDECSSRINSRGTNDLHVSRIMRKSQVIQTTLLVLVETTIATDNNNNYNNTK